MGSIHSQTQVPNTAEVRNAQARVDEWQTQAAAIAEEAVLLAASSSPVGGQVADVYSMGKNISSGNYLWAIVDGIGLIPAVGDAIKGAAKGTKIARAATRAAKGLQAAKAALSRARQMARKKAAAKAYWSQVKAKRKKILDKYKGCKDAKCAAARDKELREASKRLPKSNGKWVDKNGNPVPAGSGYWKPEPGSSLDKALAKHQQPVLGVPFKDGRPDFTGFPPASQKGTLHQVQIDMAGNSSSDITAAQNALIAKGGPNTKGSRKDGTWHHESDGVTMSYVDKDVHTAYQHPDGNKNSGTPHVGGDSMMRDPEF